MLTDWPYLHISHHLFGYVRNVNKSERENLPRTINTDAQRCSLNKIVILFIVFIFSIITEMSIFNSLTQVLSELLLDKEEENQNDLNIDEEAMENEEELLSDLSSFEDEEIPEEQEEQE